MMRRSKSLFEACLVCLTAALLSHDVLFCADSEHEVAKRRLPSGVLTDSPTLLASGRLRYTLMWSADGEVPIKLFESEMNITSDPMWTLDAAYADEVDVSMVRSNKAGSSEYWRFQKISGDWQLSSKAVLYFEPAGVKSLEFTGPTSFNILHETHPTDVIEVTNELRVANTLYHKILKNGAPFVPPGVFFNAEFPDPPKADNRPPHQEPEPTFENQKGNVSASPTTDREQLLETTKGSPLIWLLVLLVVIAGCVWAWKRQSK